MISMAKIIINILLSFYRFISSYLISKGNCRYIPSCSFFATISLKKHNVLGSVFITLRRTLRCNPFSFKGYDPVPVCFYLILN